MLHSRARRWGVTLMRRLGLASGLLVLAATVVVLAWQRHLLFPRHLLRASPRAGSDVRGLVRLTRDIPGAQIEAWFLPGDGVTAGSPGPLVIFAHGNGELIDDWAHELVRYRGLGASVLLPEYRGYGRSGGSPSEADIVSDFVYFYDQAVVRPEVDGARVAFHGRSLGGGVACGLARARPPAALILSSTFTSVADIAARYWIPRFMVLDVFDNVACVEDLEAPMLIVHGRRDSLIPFHHAEQLQRVAPHAQLVGYDADHNDCPPPGSTFWATVARFLSEAGVTST